MTFTANNPFKVLPIDAIREIRNEALNHRDGETFTMHGYTFVMPGALFAANAALLLHVGPTKTNNITSETVRDVSEFKEAIGRVCRMYGMSIDHEDPQGSFEIVPYDQSGTGWLETARIKL